MSKKFLGILIVAIMFCQQIARSENVATDSLPITMLTANVGAIIAPVSVQGATPSWVEIPAVGTYTGSPAHNNTEEIPGEAWWSATATCDGAEIYKSQFGWQTSPEFKFYAKSTTPKKYTITITLYLTTPIYKKNRDGTKGEILRYSPPLETPLSVTFTRDFWIVGIDRIEVKPVEEQDNAYITSPNEVVALVGSNCAFRAIRTPADAPAWPSGKPVWQSTKGPMVADTFFENETTARTSLTQCECGNTITKKLTKIYPELQSVDFKNGGVQTIKDVGEEPEWTRTIVENQELIRNKPFCSIINSPVDINIIISISKNLTFANQSVVSVDARVNDIVLRGGNCNFQLNKRWSLSFRISSPDKVSVSYRNFEWRYKLNGNNFQTIRNTTLCGFFTFDKHKLMNNDYFTSNHLLYACNVASGSKKLSEIGDKIGPDVMSPTFFMDDPTRYSPMTKSLSVTDNDALWLIIDEYQRFGVNSRMRARGDCAGLSTLMKKVIELLGDNSAEVAYVFPRHKSWEGLANSSMQSVESYRDDKPYPIGDYLGYVSQEKWNNYETCCVFQNKWWMGGLGSSKGDPLSVLLRVTLNNKDYGVIVPNDVNASDNHNRQCWGQQRLKSVTYPAGRPTAQQLTIKQNNN